MTGLVCIVAGGKAVAFAAAVFTPGWTHSVEKSQWQERWVASSQGFFLEEARVQGSGAGMEPGEDARREGGWWLWTPHLPPLPELVLAASGATACGWTLCDADDCRGLGGREQQPVVLQHCDGQRP